MKTRHTNVVLSETESLPFDWRGEECRFLASLRMTVGGLLGIAMLGLSMTIPAHAELILNEALANEPGSTTSAEWVEIVNWPDSGFGEINLAGYRFVDGHTTTEFDTNLIVFPGEFVVIARRPTGTGSFESIWGDGSGVWGDHESESFAVVEAKMSLRNSTDSVVLIPPFGDTSAIFWTRSNQDGVSVERIRPDGPDDPANFTACIDPLKSTPGLANSVLPVRNDIRLDSMIVSPADPKWGDTVYIALHVTNAGFGMARDIQIQVFRRLDFSDPGGPREQIGGALLTHLEEGQSTQATTTWRNARPGQHSLYAEIAADGDPSNNSGSRLVNIRHSQPLIVISEFLANPDGVMGPEEWVEISNQADFPVGMIGVELGDANGSSVIPSIVGTIVPGGFWVLAKDKTLFRLHYPDFDGMIVEVPLWPVLNNSDDQIRLIGAAGEIIDSLSYGDLFDDNRSLERIALSPAFSNPEDWEGSVDPSGATPGRANSVSRDRAGTFEVEVSPNPFYRSAGQSAEIAYRMEIGEQLTLKIFDRAGRLVRTIANETPAATGSVTWDGTDDSGGRLRPGPYVIYARSEPAGTMRKMVVVVGP